nr:tetratricopeptide repeat protein [uncultured Desulfovibrio sp.]
MNPQKNQGAGDAPLLRDLQAEVSHENAPLLQFMLRHAGLIAGVLVVFLLVLVGTGIYNWHGDSRAEEARDALARATLQHSGTDQVKALAQLAESVPSSTRFAAYMALAQSALANGDYDTAAQAYGKAAKSTDGAFSLSAALGEAGILLQAGKSAQALTLLQGLQNALPGGASVPQLRQMLAEAAIAAGQKELAARTYLALARETDGVNSSYLRTRAAELDPTLAAADEPVAPESPAADAKPKPDAAGQKDTPSKP